MSATPPINYATGELPPHLLPKALEHREREQREKERKSSIPGLFFHFLSSIIVF